MRIVITGAGGTVGTGLRPYLRAAHDLVLVDHAEPPAPHPGETWIRADINDAPAIARAMEGADAVLHLAASHGFTITFEETFETNYRGMITVFGAAVAAGVRHLVFASSNHGWGFRKAADAPLDEAAQPAPDGWYGISKLWGEAVTAFYSDAHGLSGTSLRIGHMNDHVPAERESRIWVSFRDFAALVDLVLARPAPGHRVLWATGDCDAPLFDNAAARALGWAPQDRPADFTAPGIARNAPDPKDDIGGGFAKANRKVAR